MLLKVATKQDAKTKEITWQDMYAAAIRNRLRIDQNLADLADIPTAVHNLGLDTAMSTLEEDITTAYKAYVDQAIIDARTAYDTDIKQYIDQQDGILNTKIDGAIKNFTDSIGALDGVVKQNKAALLKTISELESKVDNNKIDTDNKFNALSKTVTDNKEFSDAAEAALRKRMGDAESDIVALDSKVELYNTRITTTVENYKEELDKDISDLNKKVEDYKEELDDEDEKLNQRAKDIEDDIKNKVKPRISAVENDIANVVKPRITAVENDIADVVKPRIKAVEDDIKNNVKPDIGAIKDVLNGNALVKNLSAVGNGGHSLNLNYANFDGKILITGFVDGTRYPFYAGDDIPSGYLKTNNVINLLSSETSSPSPITIPQNGWLLICGGGKGIARFYLDNVEIAVIDGEYSARNAMCIPAKTGQVLTCSFDNHSSVNWVKLFPY